MNYIDLDFDALYTQALALYQETGGDVLFPGDEKEMLLRTVLGILQQERASLNAALAQSTIRSAEGEYLNILGENAGVERQSESYAAGTLEITLQRGASGITLEAGTLFSYGGMLTFETTQTVGETAGAGQAVLFVPIRCTTGGTAGNGITKGTQLSPIEPKAFFISCVLKDTTSGGVQEEEDDAYRKRIIESTFRKNATGSRAQYKAVALSVSAAILDASPVADEEFDDSGVGKKYALKPGQVLVSLMFTDAASEADKEQIIKSAWLALNADESRPLTDTVLVRESKSKSFTLKVRYRLQDSDTGENLRAAVLAAAEEYKTWQCAAIGRAFDPYRLTSMLYSAGCSRVDIDADASRFDGGTAQYSAVDGATRLRGTVELEEIKDD